MIGQNVCEISMNILTWISYNLNIKNKSTIYLKSFSFMIFYTLGNTEICKKWRKTFASSVNLKFWSFSLIIYIFCKYLFMSDKNVCVHFIVGNRNSTTYKYPAFSISICAARPLPTPHSLYFLFFNFFFF